MNGVMHYLCLCYRDEVALAALPGHARAARAAEAAFEREELRWRGFHPASATLHSADASAVVRVRGGRRAVAAGDGPCAGEREALGGFVLPAARDLNEAIRLAAALPAACLGRVEVRLVADFAAP